MVVVFFFQAEDGIRDGRVTGVQTCALPLAQGLAEGQRGVLDGVVRVDLGVPLGLERQVEQAVPGELGEHVVEERHAGAHRGPAGAVQPQLDEDLGLLGLPLNPGGSVHWAAPPCVLSRTSVRAMRKAAISAGVPMLTRSQPGGPTSRTSTPRSSRPRQIACESPNLPNRTKLASESAAASPRPRSQSTTPSRSARRPTTAASSVPACASAARAVAWVCADRW